MGEKYPELAEAMAPAAKGCQPMKWLHSIAMHMLRNAMKADARKRKKEQVRLGFVVQCPLFVVHYVYVVHATYYGIPTG